MTQLSLLPAFDEDVVLNAANHLLDTLNDGRKEKECYNSHNYFHHNGLYIFRASITETSPQLYNVLDENGKTPEGFSANWRSADHIKHELQMR